MPLLEDPLAVNRTRLVAALRRYSLITRAADGSVSPHRLVQAVTACHTAGILAGQWRQAAGGPRARWLFPARAGVPAGLAWLGVSCCCMPKAALAEHSGGMARLANYLGDQGG